ncbi:hypothetical protein ACFX19_028756 [Malus domestica]
MGKIEEIDKMEMGKIGEVSLPGGKTEEGDTATREAKEEIGLDPKLGINIDALVSLYWKVKVGNLS